MSPNQYNIQTRCLHEENNRQNNKHKHCLSNSVDTFNYTPSICQSNSFNTQGKYFLREPNQGNSRISLKTISFCQISLTDTY